MRILENFKRKLRYEQRVRKMLSQPERITAVYYVQQSHYNINNWDAARIIAIALYDLGSGQETLFSLQHTLEQHDILEKSEHGDELERWMLDELQEAFADRAGNHFLYWNLRDGISGFHGIEQRYQYLGGKALHDKDSRISLSRTFSVLTNENDFERLLTYNQLWEEQLLTTQQELNAVRENNFNAMERSARRKAYLMTELLQRLGLNSIKTDFNDSHVFNKTSVKIAGIAFMASVLLASIFFVVIKINDSVTLDQVATNLNGAAPNEHASTSRRDSDRADPIMQSAMTVQPKIETNRDSLPEPISETPKINPNAEEPDQDMDQFLIASDIPPTEYYAKRQDDKRMLLKQAKSNVSMTEIDPALSIQLKLDSVLGNH